MITIAQNSRYYRSPNATGDKFGGISAIGSCEPRLKQSRIAEEAFSRNVVFIRLRETGIVADILEPQCRGGGMTMCVKIGWWKYGKRWLAMTAQLMVLALLQGSCLAQSASESASTGPNAAMHKTPSGTSDPAPDLTKQPTLYVVAYAHLDTEWRWEYPRTIQEFLPKTMHDNFTLFEKYPHYIFNFSGANRYRLMKEYYPADFAKLKHYVAEGRWFPAGSSMEEGDVNSPNAESIFRQILYGSEFFRREFGKASAEYMLPDCFGFPASLPSILAHAGVKGFSTQKLTWHSSAPVGGSGSPENTPMGIPFNVGFWEGLDGKGVIAALNPGSYSGNVFSDLTKSNTPPPDFRGDYVWDWPKRIETDGQVSGLFADYHYYGTGDVGGAPREPSVEFMEAIVTKGRATLPLPRNPGEDNAQYQQRSATQKGPEVKVGDGPVKVVSSTAEQMFLDINPSEAVRLPRYRGDLELIEHSAGSLSSESYLKRWNRKNELLADAAERASVAAEWLGGRPYPRERLNNAWTLVMGGQFHDILPGTATPKAYEFAWNDQVLAMNQFASVLSSATRAVVSGLDTRSNGVSIVVYNPLNIARQDVVEASIAFDGGIPKAVRVFGPDGREVPAQLEGARNHALKVLFLANLPSVGFSVYDVRPAEAPGAFAPLKVTESSVENERYRIRLNEDGDVASIFEKNLHKELLSAPARLAFQTEKPHDWPAWNMDWEDQKKPPRGYVGGPAKVRIVEKGPVRAAVEVEREAEGSRFVQTIRLAAGDAGNRVEFGNVIDWKTAEAALKATFSFTASNPVATYNWDIGTIERGNDQEKHYEVASHQWFDLTDKSGAYGITVLSDCKNGSDKADDNTTRLTLIYTPGIGDGNGRSYSDQATQDWGRHEFVYGLAAHAADWRQGQTDWQGYQLNQPLIAFESSKHPGGFGKSLSFLNVNNSRVRILALKKAEQSDEVILRLVEISGQPEQGVGVSFAAPIREAREVNGQEMPVGKATVSSGALTLDLAPYQVRTFAVKLREASSQVAAPKSQPVPLTYNRSVASLDGTKSVGGFDAEGKSLPGEMLPSELTYSGVRFVLGGNESGKLNAVVPKGQTITLPAGQFDRVYLLAASADGDQRATFRVGGQPTELAIENWEGYIGQWDNRTWTTKEVETAPRPGASAGTPPRTRKVMEYTGLIPGFIKRAPVAWCASHRHTAEGANEAYAYSYLFAYALDLPSHAKTLTLPDNDKIRILAISVAEEGPEARAAQPLYDTLDRTAEQ